VKGCLVAVKGSLVAVNLFVTDRVISLAANISFFYGCWARIRFAFFLFFI
jgi:hypothetical protein